MQDDRSSGWAPPRDIAGLFDTYQRMLTQQNEAWMRVLRKAATGGYTPSDWMADMSDMAQKWYSEVQEHLPRPGGGSTGSDASLPTVQFELDSQAEGADAKPVSLAQRSGVQGSGAALHATPLRSLDDVAVPPGPRVTVQASPGESKVLVGLAGLRSLPAGRYLSAIEDESGRILGVVLVKRA
jgi:hypothetical protein